ncbi:MAG: hypothetical protein WC882_03490 [Candidatus Gracilibacteria bacterium]
MRFEDIKDSFRIDMVETTRGCPEGCRSCAVHDRPTKVQALTKGKIRGNIEGIVGLFNPYVTTHINTEPLRGDNFPDFAELAYELSGGRSSVIAISHGVRAGSKKMRQRLEKIVQLMKTDVIPLFILSMDFARQGLDEEQTLESYLETIGILREAFGCALVTVSLQGEESENSPLYIGKTRQLFAEAIQDLTKEERELLRIHERGYTKVGVAQVRESEDCDVIPDPDFVRDHVPQDHQWRGLVTFEGEILAQANRPGRTYGDSVIGPWKEVEF